MSRQKGYNHSEVTKEKISNIHRGKIISNEQKKKQSESMKKLYASGYTHPMLGKEHSIEAKEKISKSKLGTHVSDYVKQRVRESQVGKLVSKKTRKKMSDAKKGIKFSKEHKLKLKESMKQNWLNEEYKNNQINKRIGEKNPNWHGGIQYAPYDINWTRNFKNQIRKRDNQICMNCGKHREKLNYSLEIHHIDYNKSNSTKENCISLCKSCHSMTQINRRYWTELFYTKLAYLYGYIYTESFQIINEMKGGYNNKNVNE